VPSSHSAASVSVKRGTSPASKQLGGIAKSGRARSIGGESSIDFTSITDFQSKFSFGVSVVKVGDSL